MRISQRRAERRNFLISGRRRAIRGSQRVGFSRREKLSCNQLVVAGGRDLALLRLDVNHPDKAA